MAGSRTLLLLPLLPLLLLLRADALPRGQPQIRVPLVAKQV